MEHEHDEPLDDGDHFSMPSEAKQNRRSRFKADLAPDLRKWLTRVSRVHAQLCTLVRLYAEPSRAGGQSLLGETYAARAARGDRTLLFDALNNSAIEITSIRDAVSAAMASAPSTAAKPGSHEKVAEMTRRFQRGEWLFIDGDGDPSGPSSSVAT
jgi:hypothetical protein